MKENKPLGKTDYAYLVLKFENIIEKSDVQSSKPAQEPKPEQEPIQQQQQQQQQQEQPPPETPINNGANQGRDILNKLENVNSPQEISETDVEEGEYSITFINDPYTNILIPIKTKSSFMEEEMNTDVPTMDDGEYGDDEVDETSSGEEEEEEEEEEEIETTCPVYQSQKEEDPDEETETVDPNYYQNHKSLVKRRNNNTNNKNMYNSNKNNFLAKRNATVVEQRFSQFFVPINEYSVLKLKNVNSQNWEHEYVYVGLVHNKKVYYTHVPLLWGNGKGCVEDRSVTITLEDGNYKNIEWVNTSCKGRSCKHECIHDAMNDKEGDYERCANQDMIDNKCDIYIYVGWAGTDRDGKILLDSSQSALIIIFNKYPDFSQGEHRLSMTDIPIPSLTSPPSINPLNSSRTFSKLVFNEEILGLSKSIFLNIKAYTFLILKLY